MNRPITITATTSMEIAALKAMLFIAQGEWFGEFPNWAERYLWNINPKRKDDAEFDLEELSSVMQAWNRKVNT